ncbi:hypothetical protein FA95DRAFT_1226166 [Auriscalpium vulgare]|uniref:Uncharacterized protein n=1 Tax=Auriscalpium vulgare TaxID=40419 RepID=A0ACB8RT85_9AGAM|nr:hypothetical protein FA95DRAFT_1226166 [Auriscalpium vulgare]
MAAECVLPAFNEDAGPNTIVAAEAERKRTSLRLRVDPVIVRNIELQGVMVLAQCSHRMAYLTFSRPVWHTLLQQLVDAYIPIPNSLSHELSSAELRAIVLRAVRRHKRWSHTRLSIDAPLSVPTEPRCQSQPTLRCITPGLPTLHLFPDTGTGIC